MKRRLIFFLIITMLAVFHVQNLLYALAEGVSVNLTTVEAKVEKDILSATKAARNARVIQIKAEIQPQLTIAQNVVSELKNAKFTDARATELTTQADNIIDLYNQYTNALDSLVKEEAAYMNALAIKKQIDAIKEVNQSVADSLTAKYKSTLSAFDTRKMNRTELIQKIEDLRGEINKAKSDFIATEKEAASDKLSEEPSSLASESATTTTTGTGAEEQLTPTPQSQGTQVPTETPADTAVSTVPSIEPSYEAGTILTPIAPLPIPDLTGGTPTELAPTATPAATAVSTVPSIEPSYEAGTIPIPTAPLPISDRTSDTSAELAPISFGAIEPSYEAGTTQIPPISLLEDGGYTSNSALTTEFPTVAPIMSELPTPLRSSITNYANEHPDTFAGAVATDRGALELSSKITAVRTLTGAPRKDVYSELMKKRAEKLVPGSGWTETHLMPLKHKKIRIRRVKKGEICPIPKRK